MCIRMYVSPAWWFIAYSVIELATISADIQYILFTRVG